MSPNTTDRPSKADTKDLPAPASAPAPAPVPAPAPAHTCSFAEVVRGIKQTTVTTSSQASTPAYKRKSSNMHLHVDTVENVDTDTVVDSSEGEDDEEKADSLLGEVIDKEDLRAKMRNVSLITGQATPMNRKLGREGGRVNGRVGGKGEQDGRLPAMSMSPVACRFGPFHMKMIGGLGLEGATGISKHISSPANQNTTA